MGGRWGHGNVSQRCGGGHVKVGAIVTGVLRLSMDRSRRGPIRVPMRRGFFLVVGAIDTGGLILSMDRSRRGPVRVLMRRGFFLIVGAINTGGLRLSMDRSRRGPVRVLMRRGFFLVVGAIDTGGLILSMDRSRRGPVRVLMRRGFFLIVGAINTGGLRLSMDRSRRGPVRVLMRRGFFLIVGAINTSGLRLSMDRSRRGPVRVLMRRGFFLIVDAIDTGGLRLSMDRSRRGPMRILTRGIFMGGAISAGGLGALYFVALVVMSGFFMVFGLFRLRSGSVHLLLLLGSMCGLRVSMHSADDGVHDFASQGRTGRAGFRRLILMMFNRLRGLLLMMLSGLRRFLLVMSTGLLMAIFMMLSRLRRFLLVMFTGLLMTIVMMLSRLRRFLLVVFTVILMAIFMMLRLWGCTNGLVDIRVHRSRVIIDIRGIGLRVDRVRCLNVGCVPSVYAARSSSAIGIRSIRTLVVALLTLVAMRPTVGGVRGRQNFDVSVLIHMHGMVIRIEGVHLRRELILGAEARCVTNVNVSAFLTTLSAMGRAAMRGCGLNVSVLFDVNSVVVLIVVVHFAFKVVLESEVYIVTGINILRPSVWLMLVTAFMLGSVTTVMLGSVSAMSIRMGWGCHDIGVIINLEGVVIEVGVVCFRVELILKVVAGRVTSVDSTLLVQRVPALFVWASFLALFVTALVLFPMSLVLTSMGVMLRRRGQNSNGVLFVDVDMVIINIGRVHFMCGFARVVQFASTSNVHTIGTGGSCARLVARTLLMTILATVCLPMLTTMRRVRRGLEHIRLGVHIDRVVVLVEVVHLIGEFVTEAETNIFACINTRPSTQSLGTGHRSQHGDGDTILKTLHFASYYSFRSLPLPNQIISSTYGKERKQAEGQRASTAAININ